MIMSVRVHVLLQQSHIRIAHDNVAKILASNTCVPPCLSARVSHRTERTPNQTRARPLKDVISSNLSGIRGFIRWSIYLMYVRRTKLPSVDFSASLTQNVLAHEFVHVAQRHIVLSCALARYCTQDASALARGQSPSSRGRDIDTDTLEEGLKVKDDVTHPAVWLVGWRPHTAAIALRHSMTHEADICVFLFSAKRVR